MSDSAFFVEQLKSGDRWYDERTGRVHSKKYGRLPVAPDRLRRTHGYLKCSAIVNGRERSAPMHVVVWEFFNGPVPIGKEIHHKNGIRHDNRIQNLDAVTHSQNVIEGVKLKRKLRKRSDAWWARNG